MGEDSINVEAVDLSGKIRHYQYEYVEARSGTFSSILKDNEHAKLLKKFNHLPFPNSGSVGALVKGLPIICGGVYFPKLCIGFDPWNNSWFKHATTQVTRFLSAGDTIKGKKIIVVGGYTEDGPTNTTEIVYADGRVSFGEELPLGLMSHCAVAINETTVFIAGGIDADHELLNRAFIYDVVNGNLEEVAPMPHKRAAHVCGLIRKKDGNEYKEAVVVAGGFGETAGAFPYVDVYVLHNGAWVPGPELDAPAIGASAVQVNDSFIVVGGENSNMIHELHVDRWQWVERKETLKAPRSMMVAMAVSKSLLKEIHEDPPPPSTRVFVGNDDFGYKVIDFETGEECPVPEFTRDPIDGGIGMVFKGNPWVCGGFQSEESEFGHCYEYDSEEDKWIDGRFRLTNERDYAKAVKIGEDAWWIVGGSNAALDFPAETECLERNRYDVVVSRECPTLPFGGVKSHCAIQVNETTTFIAGGNNADLEVKDSAWLYDWSAEEWTEVGPLPEFGRRGHSCGMSYIPGTDERAIVVAGGITSDGDATATTIFLSLDTLEWSEGPDLPYLVNTASCTNLDDKSFIIFGGRVDHGAENDFILRFDPAGGENEDEGVWIEETSTLVGPALAPIVLNVPHDFGVACSSTSS